ncbi:MAG: tetratricopeptide repeat protein, partial [Phycisphaerales bacterium]|nr:tetratricopeptide repeat protein [Phycisphaerales bacterium]
EHASSALSYYSIGVTQHSLGDYKSALASQQRALNIRLKLFGEERASTADSYYGLGVIQDSLGDIKLD